MRPREKFSARRRVNPKTVPPLSQIMYGEGATDGDFMPGVPLLKDIRGVRFGVWLSAEANKGLAIDGVPVVCRFGD